MSYVPGPGKCLLFEAAPSLFEVPMVQLGITLLSLLGFIGGYWPGPGTTVTFFEPSSIRSPPFLIPRLDFPILHAGIVLI